METKKIRLPRGVRNNNPLNIRKGNNWQGERPNQTDPAFEEFVSLEMGFRAGLKILKRYISGNDGRYQPRDTIRLIIQRWAPPAENATQKYIDTVCQRTGFKPDQQIWFSHRDDICRIAQAMAWVECGQLFPLSIIETAYDLI